MYIYYLTTTYQNCLTNYDPLKFYRPKPKSLVPPLNTSTSVIVEDIVKGFCEGKVNEYNLFNQQNQLLFHIVFKTRHFELSKIIRFIL